MARIPIGIGVLPQNVSWSAEQSISQLPNFGKMGLTPRFGGDIRAAVVSPWVPESYRLEVRSNQKDGLVTSFLTFPEKALRENGGNPFEIMRAAQTLADSILPQRALCAREELEFEPNPARESNLALRWTNGELSRWISLVLHALRQPDDGGPYVALRGGLGDAMSVVEEVLFAVPLAQRARLTFGIGDLFEPEATSPYLRLVTECHGNSRPWTVDCVGRVIVGPALDHTKSAYENWVLLNLLHPGATYIRECRDDAWAFAQWLESTDGGAVPSTVPASVAESVVASNQELLTKLVASWSDERRAAFGAYAGTWSSRPGWLDGVLNPNATPASTASKGGWLSRLFGRG